MNDRGFARSPRSEEEWRMAEEKIISPGETA